MKRCLPALALAVLLAGAALAAPAAPLNEIVLRDPFITRAPDGTFYLTGTTNVNSLDPRYADFQNNDGVRLWSSSDLKTWQPVGLVWDLSKTGGRDARKSGWQAHLRAVPNQPDRPWSRGVTAPELHILKGTWFIVFALNDQDIGLLKSKSGKPAGPYEEIGRLSNRFLGGDPSLFEAADGKVYLVWGAGYVAPMKDDMSDIAEEPKSLQIAIGGYPADEPAPNQLRPRGAFLHRAGETVRYLYAAWTLRDGKGHFDTLVCTSASPLGPFSKPTVLIPDGGQAALFTDADGTLRAVYAAGDHPVIVPVK